VAGGALTMFQTDERIHWTAQQLLKEMRRICGIDERQASCEHEWKQVAGVSDMQTFKQTAWLYACEKCHATKEEAI